MNEIAKRRLDAVLEQHKYVAEELTRRNWTHGVAEAAATLVLAARVVDLEYSLIETLPVAGEGR
jgi:hypothetical protein